MLTRGLTCLLLLIVATPAAAKTYTGRADAGPAIAGDNVLWGLQNRDGSGVLKRDGRVFERFADPAGRKQRRVFGGVPGALSGSPTRVAYVLDDQVVSQHDDVVDVAVKVSVRLSIAGGPFTDPLACTGAYMSTAVEADNVAFAVAGQPPCAGIYVNGRKISESESAQVRVAGPYVAWSGYPDFKTISVADLSTGAVLATFPGRWETFDLDERGTIVGIIGKKLVTFTLADPRQRVLARKAWYSGVATAAGRVAYISERSDGAADRLIIADLNGKVLKRLERYNQRRWPAGEIALTDRRVAWSVRGGRNEEIHAPGNVRTVKL